MGMWHRIPGEKQAQAPRTSGAPFGGKGGLSRTLRPRRPPSSWDSSQVLAGTLYSTEMKSKM